MIHLCPGSPTFTSKPHPFNFFSRFCEWCLTIWGHSSPFLWPHNHSRQASKNHFSIRFNANITTTYQFIQKTWSLAHWGLHYLENPWSQVIVGDSCSLSCSCLFNVGATVVQSFPFSLYSSHAVFWIYLPTKKLQKMCKSTFKPNWPISCSFTVKASKLCQNLLHYFYANVMTDGTSSVNSCFMYDSRVKYNHVKLHALSPECLHNSQALWRMEKLMRVKEKWECA